LITRALKKMGYLTILTVKRLPTSLYSQGSALHGRVKHLGSGRKAVTKTLATSCSQMIISTPQKKRKKKERMRTALQASNLLVPIPPALSLTSEIQPWRSLTRTCRLGQPLMSECSSMKNLKAIAIPHLPNITRGQLRGSSRSFLAE
jgi:hypothetical protein